jgi:hypothetical protein
LQRLQRLHDQAQPPQPQGNGPLQEGLQRGVQAGAQRYATELVAGALAQQSGLPEGAPTHIGTVPGGPSPAQQAAAPPPPNPAGMQ